MKVLSCKAIPPIEIAINRKPKTDNGGRFAKLSKISNPSLSIDFPYPMKIFYVNIKNLGFNLYKTIKLHNGAAYSIADGI